MCHCQLGGRDQWGNITAGCDYIRKATGSIVHGELTKMSPWCHHDVANKSSFLYLITELISSNLLLLSNPLGWDEARVKWPGISFVLRLFSTYIAYVSLCSLVLRPSIAANMLTVLRRMTSVKYLEA